jgi:hypothetical protein
VLILLESYAQVLGGDVLAAVPLAFEPVFVVGEYGGEQLHDLGDEPVRRAYGVLWVVDESLLVLLPLDSEVFGLFGFEEWRGIGPVRRHVAFAGRGVRFASCRVRGSGPRSRLAGIGDRGPVITCRLSRCLCLGLRDVLDGQASWTGVAFSPRPNLLSRRMSLHLHCLVCGGVRSVAAVRWALISGSRPTERCRLSAVRRTRRGSGPWRSAVPRLRCSCLRRDG